MPVILPPELYDFWLNEDSREPELKEILLPFPASEMTSHAVSYEVNDVKNEGEHLLAPCQTQHRRESTVVLSHRLHGLNPDLNVFSFTFFACDDAGVNRLACS